MKKVLKVRVRRRYIILLIFAVLLAASLKPAFSSHNCQLKQGIDIGFEPLRWSCQATTADIFFECLFALSVMVIIGMSLFIIFNGLQRWKRRR